MQPPAFRRAASSLQANAGNPPIQTDWMDRIVAFLFRPSGRVSRLAYRVSSSGFYLVYFCLYRVGHQIRVDLNTSVASPAADPAAMLYVLTELLVLFLAFGITFGSCVVVSIKRWHDLDKSGLFALLCFVPILGWAVQLFVGSLVPGKAGANRYGPPPR
jgi:uncharacterized membrane protein YhaH (DUF805 family)